MSPARAPVLAALLMLGSVAVVAVQNALIRVVADEGIHAFQIVLYRNIFGLLSVAAIVLWTERGIPRTRLLGMIGLACILHVGSMLAGFLGVALLPLNESTALGFAGPLFATMGAALFLGETVRARRWTAIGAGFVGVLIILRPGYVPIELGAAMTLASALLGAASTLMFKHFTGSERGATLILYQTVFSVLMSVPPAVVVWETPDTTQVAMMAVIGVLGTVSWMLFLRAFALGDASAVFPYEFARLPFVALLAYLVFGEVPDQWVWLGATVIFGSNLYIVHREAIVAREIGRTASAR